MGFCIQFFLINQHAARVFSKLSQAVDLQENTKNR